MAVLVVPIRSFRSGFAAPRDAPRRRRTQSARATTRRSRRRRCGHDGVRRGQFRPRRRWVGGGSRRHRRRRSGLARRGRRSRPCTGARSTGTVRVVVAHADLPFVSALDRMATPGAEPVALIVPDRHDDGTPVLSLPAGAEIAFQYGPGSFGRHVEAAPPAAGLTVEIVRDELLGFDIDEPADLDAATARDAPR